MTGLGEGRGRPSPRMQLERATIRKHIRTLWWVALTWVVKIALAMTAKEGGGEGGREWAGRGGAVFIRAKFSPPA